MRPVPRSPVSIAAILASALLVPISGSIRADLPPVPPLDRPAPRLQPPPTPEERQRVRRVAEPPPEGGGEALGVEPEALPASPVDVERYTLAIRVTPPP